MTTEIPRGLYCYHAPIVTLLCGVPVITKLKCPHFVYSVMDCCEKYEKEIEDLCKCDECLSNDREDEE